jgi:hypothetical protein
MDLPKQKDFYDVKRQFQGRDQPTDVHPDVDVQQPVPRGQIVFGVVFFLFVAFLAFLRVRDARSELVPTTPAAAAAPAKK